MLPGRYQYVTPPAALARAMSMTRTASPAPPGRRCRAGCLADGPGDDIGRIWHRWLAQVDGGRHADTGQGTRGDAHSQAGRFTTRNADPSGAQGSQTVGVVGNTGDVADPGHDGDRTCAGDRPPGPLDRSSQWWHLGWRPTASSSSSRSLRQPQGGSPSCGKNKPEKRASRLVRHLRRGQAGRTSGCPWVTAPMPARPSLPMLKAPSISH